MASNATAAPVFPPEFLEYNTGSELVTQIIVMTVLATVIMSLRLGIRYHQFQKWSIDDWLILSSYPVLLLLAASGIAATINGGVGRHLAVNMMADPQRFSRCLLYLWLAEFSYGTVCALIKCSILTMYYRIFPTRFMKTGTRLLFVLVAAWWVAVMLVTIFQCMPVQKAWDPYMEDGTCLEKEKFFLGNAIPNIITDILILGLPTFEVVRLQVTRSQKVAITGIFLLGGLVVVIAGIRLKSLTNLLGDDVDFTDAIGPAWAWTLAEPAVGVITASLPCLRPLLRFIFGKLFNKGSKDTRERNKDLITIGGTGVITKRVPFTKPKSGSRSDSFEQLEEDTDREWAGETGLWPKGYENERKTTVFGKRPPSEGERSDEIPLDSIAVKHDVSWTEENRPHETPASRGSQ
ncbi:integral membrane [Diplogelasinospora grovesii]|uniref:Integral membrane n=1 Tax=Diplogelasinospora grovesii TaxID=303347 RepID=A0AAN6N057_9PEZI|nr:integral membrane [Diplogelasinospora grovesii]